GGVVQVAAVVDVDGADRACACADDGGGGGSGAAAQVERATAAGVADVEGGGTEGSATVDGDRADAGCAAADGERAADAADGAVAERVGAGGRGGSVGVADDGIGGHGERAAGLVERAVAGVVQPKHRVSRAADVKLERVLV